MTENCLQIGRFRRGKEIQQKSKNMITLGAAVLAGAVGFGCFRVVYQSHFNGTVAVYSASDNSISTSESNWRGGGQYDGTIQADGVQTVMISESQTVGEVAVKEGQQVKKGDKLFSYDTTLSDLDMQRAQLDIEKAGITAENGKKQPENCAEISSGPTDSGTDYADRSG